MTAAAKEAAAGGPGDRLPIPWLGRLGPPGSGPSVLTAGLAERAAGLAAEGSCFDCPSEAAAIAATAAVRAERAGTASEQRAKVLKEH